MSTWQFSRPDFAQGFKEAKQLLNPLQRCALCACAKTRAHAPARPGRPFWSMALCMTKSWQCVLCRGIYCSLFVPVGHIRASHSHAPGLSFTCGVEGCPETFHNTNTFYKHVTSKHSSVYKLGKEKEGTNTHSEQSGEENSTESNTECNAEGSTQASCNVDMHDGDDLVVPQENDAANVATGYLLRLKSRPGITQSSLVEVVAMNDAVVNSVLDHTSSDLCCVLESHGIEEHSSLAISVQSVLEKHKDPLSNLRTTYRQSSAIQSQYQAAVRG